MGMATAFLFMKNNGSWLALQAQPLLGQFNSSFKNIDRDSLGRRWAQAEREERLFSTGALAHRVDFIEGGMKVVGQKAP